jgi:NTE family protein
MPSIFTPVEKNNTLLVDGGVLNNIPVNHAKRIPNDLLIAVDVNADVPVLKLNSSKKELQEKQTLYQEKIQNFHNQLNAYFSIR